MIVYTSVFIPYKHNKPKAYICIQSTLRTLFFTILILFAQLGYTQFLIDSSYGAKGQVFISLPDARYTQLQDLKLLSNGNSLALMTRWTTGGIDAWLAQFDSKGNPITSFGFNGFLPISEYATATQFGKMFLDTSDNIYVWGLNTSFIPSGSYYQYKQWFHKYFPNGDVDTAFHPLDSITNQNANQGSCFYVQPASNGSFYISTGASGGALWRINKNNIADSTWGGDGRVDSLCQCAKGVFESSDGSVNVVGSPIGSNMQVIWILNRFGIRDLKRTVSGWLSAPTGPASILAQGDFCINTLDYTKKGLEIKTLAYQNAFVAKPGFGNNGRNSIPIDSGCWGEPVFSMETKNGHIITGWNRYLLDDNNNYIGYKAGLNVVNAQGIPIPYYTGSSRRYLMPKELNNHSIVSYLEQQDSSFLGGFNIWNNGSYASLLVKFKPSEMDLSASIPSNSYFVLYPNPADKRLNIDIPIEKTASKILLHSATGQSWILGLNIKSHWQFDCNGYANGLYTLEVQFSDGTRSAQWVQIMHD